jgi:hypothetical protein
MQNRSICTYCGKDTSEIEYDYVDGQDHLECILQSELKNTYIDQISVSNSLIQNTPNDYELGKKVRELYWQHKN